MLWHAQMTDFRQMHIRGMKEVQRAMNLGTCARDEAETALKEYRAILGIIDAMTPAERENPVERIDSRRMRRISLGAGVRDQQVIQLLISMHQFNELVLRAEMGIVD